MITTYDELPDMLKLAVSEFLLKDAINTVLDTTPTLYEYSRGDLSVLPIPIDDIIDALEFYLPEKDTSNTDWEAVFSTTPLQTLGPIPFKITLSHIAPNSFEFTKKEFMIKGKVQPTHFTGSRTLNVIPFMYEVYVVPSQPEILAQEEEEHPFKQGTPEAVFVQQLLEKSKHNTVWAIDELFSMYEKLLRWDPDEDDPLKEFALFIDDLQGLEIIRSLPNDREKFKINPEFLHENLPQKEPEVEFPEHWEIEDLAYELLDYLRMFENKKWRWRDIIDVLRDKIIAPGLSLPVGMPVFQVAKNIIDLLIRKNEITETTGFKDQRDRIYKLSSIKSSQALPHEENALAPLEKGILETVQTVSEKKGRPPQGFSINVKHKDLSWDRIYPILESLEDKGMITHSPPHLPVSQPLDVTWEVSPQGEQFLLSVPPEQEEITVPPERKVHEPAQPWWEMETSPTKMVTVEDLLAAPSDNPLVELFSRNPEGKFMEAIVWGFTPDGVVLRTKEQEGRSDLETVPISQISSVIRRILVGSEVATKLFHISRSLQTF